MINTKKHFKQKSQLSRIKNRTQNKRKFQISIINLPEVSNASNFFARANFDFFEEGTTPAPGVSWVKTPPLYLP
jgi:hypothetical protein